MPQALAGAILPWVIQAMGWLGIPIATIAASATLVATGLAYLAFAGAALLVSSAFSPPVPEAPKPEDGKYNLKQSVPPLVYVLGRVKKAGDYAFLEEKGGLVHHVMVHAAHPIKGYAQHWLHDQIVTVAGGIVTSPPNVAGSVLIDTRLGANASTAYATLVGQFPTIWTNDHRGDGLATVYMQVGTVPTEDLQYVFPNGMPQHSAVIEGHNALIDPRTMASGYSENLAIFRMWHLTHPVGGKLTLSDLHLPDWANAASVCDQFVTEREGAFVPRYHGGLWFRANNDPVQVGRLMDQAAELVIYERADGKVGVHAGEYVEPDVRLTANDIISLSYDPNKRRASTVLAVRGRYTDPSKHYNTADAAIYGVPYPTEDERTKTVDNQVVQRHNHVARMQKLAYIRANAPRVKVVAHYEAARNVPYRRFVRVHYPPRLTEAVIEIIGRPTLSLRNLTYEFEGIVVPPTLYAFNAATEEGEPGASITPVDRQDVPVPKDFDVTIQQEDVGGGSLAAFGQATFTFQNATFQYELEWQKTSGGDALTNMGRAGETSVRSLYLVDGVEYRFRARTWSAGTPSAWTGYIVRTATADPNPPGIVTSVSATGGTGEVEFAWTAPNSPNYVGAKLYLNSSNSMAGATLVAIEYGPPNVVDTRTVSSIPAGTWFGFVAAANGSGVEATPQPTGAISVA